MHTWAEVRSAIERLYINDGDGVDGSTAKYVLWAVHSFGSSDGRCWPSVGRIAEMTQLGERTVQRALRHLQGLGVVQINERSSHGGRSTSNLYTVDFVRIMEGCRGGTDEGATVTPLEPTIGKSPSVYWDASKLSIAVSPTQMAEWARQLSTSVEEIGVKLLVASTWIKGHEVPEDLATFVIRWLTREPAKKEAGDGRSKRRVQEFEEPPIDTTSRSAGDVAARNREARSRTKGPSGPAWAIGLAPPAPGVPGPQ